MPVVRIQSSRFADDVPHLEGLLEFDEGRPSVGLARLEKAFDLQPQSRFVAGDLAEAYVRHERYADAVEVIAQGLQHHAGDERLLRIYDEIKRHAS